MFKQNYLHYEKIGEEWIWFWHSWVDGKTNDGELYSRYYYCTNAEGEGIFIADREKNECKQIVGTCQFSLVGLKDPKRAIRRIYEN